jgi:hypothetical protein
MGQPIARAVGESSHHAECLPRDALAAGAALPGGLLAICASARADSYANCRTGQHYADHARAGYLHAFAHADDRADRYTDPDPDAYRDSRPDCHANLNA